MPVAACVLYGLEQRLFGGGAAKAAVAGDVGVGEAEFGAAAREFASKFFHIDCGALLSVMSGILLAGVEDGHHLYCVGDAIDEDVIGRDL